MSDKYVDSFCFENTDYHSYRDKNTNKLHITFDTPQAMLALRLGRHTRENILEDEANQKVNVSFGLFDFFNMYNGNKREIFDCSAQIGKSRDMEGLFGLSEKVLANENYFNENLEESKLNYDGLCAFLALAPEKLIFNSREFVFNEIERNLSEELDWAEKRGLSNDRTNQISEKYLELGFVAGKMFEQANEKLMEEEQIKIGVSVACESNDFEANLNAEE